MKTLRILNISTPKQLVDGEGKKLAQPTILVAIQTEKFTVIRTVKQFCKDLSNSFLVEEGVESLSHPDVRRCMRDLRGGLVTADLAEYKKGSTYIADENSRRVKEGKAKIGDTIVRETDSVRVEGNGFLSLEVNDRADLNTRIADSKRAADQANFFNSFAASSFAEDEIEEEEAEEVAPVVDTKVKVGSGNGKGKGKA